MNPLMIEKLSSLNKEVILSTGLGQINELDNAINILKNNKSDFGILQCTTEYPSKPQNIGLKWIDYFNKRYSCPVGLSDHSGEIYPSIAAVALGASII